MLIQFHPDLIGDCCLQDVNGRVDLMLVQSDSDLRGEGYLTDVTGCKGKDERRGDREGGEETP